MISLPAIYGRLASTTTTRPRYYAASSRLSAWQTLYNQNQNNEPARRRMFATSSRNRREPRAVGSKGRKRQEINAGKYFANLQEAGKAIDNILSRFSKVDPPEQTLVSSRPPTKKEEEFMLARLKDTKAFFSMLISSVDQKQFNPRGKHGKELSRLLELVLFVYSQLNLPLHDDSQEVLGTLKEWNLDVRSRHTDYAIVTANREFRWKEASDMFWTQISPEAGYNPVDVSISSPHGLFAVARCAQEQNAAVVENVFDAIQQLSMVSPADQRTCKFPANAEGNIGPILCTQPIVSI
jgi:hypothetical protein